MEQILLSSSISLMHTSPTTALQGSYTSADSGMHLVHASVQTGLSPFLSSISPDLVYKYSLVTSSSTHALAECFPIGALNGS